SGESGSSNGISSEDTSFSLPGGENASFRLPGHPPFEGLARRFSRNTFSMHRDANRDLYSRPEALTAAPTEGGTYEESQADRRGRARRGALRSRHGGARECRPTGSGLRRGRPGLELPDHRLAGHSAVSGLLRPDVRV